jgi:glycosyltransferase involved in cell wall biosynthesis
MDQKKSEAQLGPRSRFFPMLQADASVAGSHARVCIVTPEILGPIRNGDIATVYTSLATILAYEGHEVTILLTCDRCESGTMAGWQNSYASKGVTLTPLQRSGRHAMAQTADAATSYEVLVWLRDNQARFDVVHFGEWRGLGYYSLLAKRQGIAFSDLAMCVKTHGPISLFDPELSQLELIVQDFMERESVRLADVLLSPSNYLLQWMLKDGWKLPDATFVSPHPVLSLRAPRPVDRGDRADLDPKGIRELVFFGPLHTGKGLTLFCDAIDRLHRRSPSVLPRITFMGNTVPIRGEDSGDYARRRGQPWGVDVNILSKDRDDALDYLGGEGVMAAIPSLDDNSPYTVLECIARRVSFLASAVGGIPEQIAECDLERVCFQPHPDALAAKIEQALRNPPAPAAAAFDFAENNSTVVRWHEALVTAAKRIREEKQHRHPVTAENQVRPLVSVCLIHHERPDFLRQAIESLRKQDYSPFEVILADDGSMTPAALAFLDSLESEFHERGWRIVRGEHQHAGAARNNAARWSHGDYLLFMDDDNYACAEELSLAVAVAQKTNADILTFARNLWEGDHPPPLQAADDAACSLPLGACVSAGMFQNVFGDTNALIKRSVFEELGGFREIHGVGGQDWELWARAVLRGFSLQVIPLPLFWYRLHPAGISGTTDAITNGLFASSPYLASVPKELRPAVALAIKRFWTEQQRSSEGSRGVGLTLRNQIDALWNSTSWRALRPLRNLLRAISGRPQENKPSARTDYEALEAVLRLMKSTSWNLTAPIRLAGRLLGIRGQKAKSPPHQS